MGNGFKVGGAGFRDFIFVEGLVSRRVGATPYLCIYNNLNYHFTM